MKCPFCKSITKVTKTLPLKDGTRKRLRSCKKCAFRGTYIEVLKIINDRPNNLTASKDGNDLKQSKG